jgi:ribosomal protein S27E
MQLVFNFDERINKGEDRLTFSIIKCNKCGRILVVYHCAHKRVECTNKTCGNKIWIEKESAMAIRFGTDFVPESNAAYIFINAFNSYAYLCAKVYSQDGNNSMIIPISERNVGNLTRKDTLMAIPADVKHTTSWDGLVIKSGCYPVSPEMETEIKKNIYTRESNNA